MFTLFLNSVKFLVAQKCIKKDVGIHIFYLRKLSQNWSPFSSTELVESNIWHKKCLLLTQYFKKCTSKSRELTKVKKICIFLDPFLCNFVRLNTSDKLSINVYGMCMFIYFFTNYDCFHIPTTFDNVKKNLFSQMNF